MLASHRSCTRTYAGPSTYASSTSLGYMPTDVGTVPFLPADEPPYSLDRVDLQQRRQQCGEVLGDDSWVRL